MKNSHICFINTTKAWGGGEKWHFDMSLAMQREGFTVSAIAHREGELYQRWKQSNPQIDVTGIQLTGLSFLNPVKHWEISKILKENKVDTVILNLSRDLKVASPAARKAGVRNIIYRRGSAIPIKNNWLNRYNFKHNLTHILANSEATKQTVLANNPKLFPPEKIKVIYNGIRFEEYKTPSGNKLFPELHEKFIIGTLGRMVFQKGHEDLVEMAAELKSSKLPFHIVIGGDGHLKDALVDKIRSNGLEAYFTLPGFINDTPQFMASIDLFVLPSRWEGFGYVLVEAMAMGKPVIAYNLSSNPEIVAGTKTGYLAEPLNVKALAEKVRLLMENKPLYQSLAANCRSYVEEKFSVEQTQRNLKNFLLEL